MLVVATVGVPASGKSTWARAETARREAVGERWAILCQDDIRLALIADDLPAGFDPKAELRRWNYDPAGPSEARVRERWDLLARQALADGLDGLILADSNLIDAAEAKFKKLEAFGADPAGFSSRFFEISFDEALERDGAREFSVGPAAMALQFARLESLRAAGKIPETPRSPCPSSKPR